MGTNAALAATAQNWAVIAGALYGGIVNLRRAIAKGSRSRSGNTVQRESELSKQDRIEHADDEREVPSALRSYVVAGVCFGIACATLAQAVPPIVGYAILCLAFAARIAQVQIAEERAPRRRSVLLGRSRRVDPVLATWIGLSALYSLLLVPFIFDEPSRGPAIVVAACVATMVVVAWRIANAPPLLFGRDIEAEQIVDRETRASRTGTTCFFATVTVFVFIGFVWGPTILEEAALALVWVGLLVWKSLYARHLSQTPLAS